MRFILKLLAGLVIYFGLVAGYTIAMTPFLIAIVILFFLFDSIFNMYSFVTFWCILNGLFLGWSFVNKDKTYFYSIVVWTIVIGLFLLSAFEPNFEMNQEFYDRYIYYPTLIPLACFGLIFGYGLYKLGFLTLLKEIYKIYDFIRWRSVPVKWLVIYYYCKYKKFNVYDDLDYEVYRERHTKPTLITVTKRGELSISAYIKSEENGVLPLETIKAKLSARLQIYPKMDVIVSCESYISISVVYKLVTSLLKNEVNEIGLRME